MELALGLAMRPVASPALLEFAGMLALSAAELEGVVAQELSANPALERADGCPACGSRVHAYCGGAGGGPPQGERTDWPAATTGAEELLAELRCAATEKEAKLAGYLLGCLDDRGFLPGGPEQVAADLGIAVAEVNGALDALRRAGPPAIGARDVRESLLLQLAGEGTRAGTRRELARVIACRYLEPLARGQLETIASGLGCPLRDVAGCVLYIRRHCTPSPAPGLRTPAAATRVPAVPDVVITRQLRVETLELGLRIDPGYARLAARSELVGKASAFISRLEERAGTIRRIVRYAASRQHAFVLRGPRYLRPLAQADVARDLGIHESTVSRAVAGKYMMLPSRAVVPVQDFFRSALAPQDALRELIAAETRPLTDTELAGQLAAQGFPVARRTVAKYRHALGLPAAPLREPALAAAAKLGSQPRRNKLRVCSD